MKLPTRFKASTVSLAVVLFTPVFLLGGYALATHDLYGAIAYSRSTGAHSYSLNYVDRALAEEQAVNACKDVANSNDCEALLWFRNTCGALARYKTNPVENSILGTGWDRDLREAEAKAEENCEANGGERCIVIRSECTGS